MSSAPAPADSEGPLWRLYVIRIACIYFAGWGFFHILPE